MAFALLALQGLNLPDHWFIVTTLFSRSFGIQRAICNLLVRGYYPEAMILRRAAFESTDLAVYCSTSAQRAWDWQNGKEVKHGAIREAVEFALPKEMYKWLSKHVHHGSQGVMPYMDTSISNPSQGDMTIHLLGAWDQGKLLEGVDLLLESAAYAVLAMDRAYSEVLRNYEDWPRDVRDVIGAVYPEEFHQALAETETR